MAESGCLMDGKFQNLEVTGNTLYKSDSHILVRSATTAHDLTATTSDLTVVYTGTQAGAITLPQATTSNVGLVIKIIFAADAATTAFKLGFADAASGATTLIGPLTLGSNAGSETVDGFRITASAESLEIDANDETAAGGAVGSYYIFTYYGEGTVFCEAKGMCTTGTPALDANAATTTGTS